MDNNIDPLITMSKEVKEEQEGLNDFLDGVRLLIIIVAAVVILVLVGLLFGLIPGLVISFIFFVLMSIISKSKMKKTFKDSQDMSIDQIIANERIREQEEIKNKFGN